MTDMPSWNIHLEAGERLSRKIHFSGKKRKEFLFGCLLPDINNGYINKVSTLKYHEETHYTFNQKSSLNFYAENKAKIDARDPIYLGYLFHLYTDGFFNYDFYRTVKHHRIGKGLNHDQKRDIKHHDFWLYDTNFKHHLKIADDELAEITKHANQVPAVEITSEDIKNVETLLLDEHLNDKIKGDKYQFYTKKRLDDLLEDMIESFYNDYLGEGDA